jgi:hypothetical protein
LTNITGKMVPNVINVAGIRPLESINIGARGTDINTQVLAHQRSYCGLTMANVANINQVKVITQAIRKLLGSVMTIITDIRSAKPIITLNPVVRSCCSTFDELLDIKRHHLDFCL